MSVPLLIEMSYNKQLGCRSHNINIVNCTLTYRVQSRAVYNIQLTAQCTLQNEQYYSVDAAVSNIKTFFLNAPIRPKLVGSLNTDIAITMFHLRIVVFHQVESIFHSDKVCESSSPFHSLQKQKKTNKRSLTFPCIYKVPVGLSHSHETDEI